VLVVGATEPEVLPWLRAAGHAPHAVPRVSEALRIMEKNPIDLVIVDRDRDGHDAAEVCRALRAGMSELTDPWLLAITVAAKGKGADAALDAGADDYLHRPFTRGELLARSRAGLRAAQQRADDALVRALMVNVPGAIYRSAWHAGHTVELISDEIERISGYPAANFIASSKRTILSIIHPRDRKRVMRAVAAVTEDSPTLNVEYRILRADAGTRWVLDRGLLVPGPGGRRWMDGALFDITERRAAEEALRHREIDRARTEELRASRIRIVEAADAARRKIERDLHDGAQQRLVTLGLDVRIARKRFERDPDSAAEFLERMGDELSAASAELRELARGIHPAVLTERGLAAAVEGLATRSTVPVEVLEVPRERLAGSTEATAYFTVAEALTNVAKYADASHATVRITRERSSLVVEVRDDGIGGAQAANGSGLSGLADRVGAVDGRLTVKSPVGEGTTIRAVLPLDREGSSSSASRGNGQAPRRS
jgi:PAS domain S-box-containing protein